MYLLVYCSVLTQYWNCQGTCADFTSNFRHCWQFCRFELSSRNASANSPNMFKVISSINILGAHILCNHADWSTNHGIGVRFVRFRKIGLCCTAKKIALIFPGFIYLSETFAAKARHGHWTGLYLSLVFQDNSSKKNYSYCEHLMHSFVGIDEQWHSVLGLWLHLKQSSKKKHSSFVLS